MLLIARRYLLSPKSHSVVNIIAGVSFVSLLTPVAAVILLLSVFNGFGDMLSSREESIEGDLTVRPRHGRLFEMESLDREAIEAIDGVRSVSFVSEQSALLEYDGQSAVVLLRGGDDAYLSTVALYDIVNVGWITSGGEEASIIIGGVLASRLGVRRLYDGEARILSLRSGGAQSLVPIVRESSVSATITGVFSLDEQREGRYVYTSQRVVNELIGGGDIASRLSISIEEGASEGVVRLEVERIVGGAYRVDSRDELNPTLYEIVRYEKLGVLLISIFVMVLALFSLMGSLTMLILEKSGEISTLRAMGATIGDVTRLFVMEGVLIGATAIVVGVVVGCGLTLGQQLSGVVELPTSSSVPIPYPVVLQAGDVVLVVAIALAMVLSISWLVTRVMMRRILR